MNKTLITSYLRPLIPKPTLMQPQGGLKQPIRCLLCDIYGTLFISGSSSDLPSISSSGQTEMLQQLIDKYRQPFTASELLAQFRTAIEADHRKSKKAGVDFPEVRIDRIWQSILQRPSRKQVLAFATEFEMIVNPVWPMPGIKVLLARCRQLDIHLGIISNAQFYTPFLFEWFLDADTTALGFDPRLTVYSFQHGVAKPSLLLFQLAARRLKRFGIAPHETAFIGNDVFNDIAPSLETGFQTILFAGDARSLRLRKNHPSCCEISADLVITDLAQIEHYLG